MATKICDFFNKMQNTHTYQLKIFFFINLVHSQNKKLKTSDVNI